MSRSQIRSVLLGALAVTALVVAGAGVPVADAAPAPSRITISPSSGSFKGGMVVEVRGRGFTGATAVSFGRYGNARSFTVDSDTSITAISPPGYMGTVDVAVRGPNRSALNILSETSRFTYLAPTVTAVSPSSGSLRGGNTVMITGTGLGRARGVDFGGNGESPSFRINSDSSISAVVPSARYAGTSSVTVYLDNAYHEESVADHYTYLAETSSLKVTSVSPSSGQPGGGNTVRISGAGFVGVSSVTFGEVGRDANSFKVDSPTSITAVAPSSGPLGPRDVRVYVRDDTASTPVSAGDVYTYLSPTITGVSPSRGSWGTTVTIQGTGFAKVDRLSFCSAGDPAQFTINSDTSITAIAPRCKPGSVDIQTSVNNSSIYPKVTVGDRFTYAGLVKSPPGS